jgi:hypothetical protein
MRAIARFGGVVGCAALVGAMMAPSTAHAATTEVERAAADAVARLRDAGIVAHQRASAIAAMPSVVYGVATDQQTMLDLTADELSIHALPGETVEIAQQSLKGGAVVSLRREGTGELVHLPLQTPGLHIVDVAGRLYAIAVVQLKPRDRADVVRGLVGVARAVDLAPVSAKLAALGAAIDVRVDGGSFTLGQPPSTVAATIVQHPPLGADVDPELTLFVPPSLASSSSPLGAASLGLLGLGIVVGVVLFRRRRSLAAAVAAYPHVDGGEQRLRASR